MEKKTERIYIRLTEKEKREIKKKADNLGIKTSEYLREISTKKEVIFIDNSVLNQIRKIGLNVNQIIRLSHTYKNPPSQNLIDEINELKKMIIELTNKSNPVKNDS